MSDRRPTQGEQAHEETDVSAAERPLSPEAWFRELAAALGWNPLVGADIRPVVESCARTADAWTSANRIALGAALAVAECQFRVLCQAMEESVSANADLLSGANPAKALPTQAWRAVRGFDRLLEDLRELGATVARSQLEIADTLNRRLTELGDEVEQYVLRLKQ
jgi:phasin family protein